MLHNLALRQKLTGGFGLVVVTMVLAEIFSIVQIRTLASFVSRAAEINQLTEIGALAADMVGLERAIVLYSIFDDKANVQQYKIKLDTSSKTFQESLEKISTSATSENARQNLAALRDKYSAWAGMHKEIVANLDRQQVDVAEKKVADPSYTALVEDMRRLGNEMSDREAKSLNQEAGRAVLVCFIGFATLAVVFLSAGGAVLLYVRRLSSVLGGLTDSLGASSEQVEKLSADVQQASESLAKESSAQASSLETTSASSEEITAMTRRNVESSKAAAGVMTEVDEYIKAGNRTLDLMVVSMKEINTSSDKVSKIIRVIDEIAFQTNILALNAAVEAARAGEAGMGFAVVADEVRNLAQRSAQAAKDTAAMIEESIVKSNDGSAKLRELTDMIRLITEGASKVKMLVDDVSTGSKEQARGIEQISTAVSQMEQMTQNAARTTSASATASDDLSTQARSLNEVVIELRGLVEGR